MKNKIIEYFKRNGGIGISFAELSKRIEGFNGEIAMTFSKKPNLVMWAGMSREAFDAMRELMEERKISITSTTQLVYLIDGMSLQLPIAKRFKDYKKEHWLPVTMRLMRDNKNA